jgi:hypothetical protein
VFQPVDIEKELESVRSRTRMGADIVLDETRRILNRDLFTEKKILENLGQYNKAFELVDDDKVDQDAIFHLAEIRRAAIVWRLKFLESRCLKSEIPYEAVLKIKEFDERQGKELKHFRVLSLPTAFRSANEIRQTLLFAMTVNENYYLIHRWGKPLSRWRKYIWLPFRTFEFLVITVLLVTLAVTMSLPTWLITLDPRAEYWSGYRTAAFLHIFIFNLGFTAFITFAFTKNFSSSIWNRENDFG